MRAAFTINRTAKACLLLAAGILSGGIEATAGSIGNPVQIAMRRGESVYNWEEEHSEYHETITTTTNPLTQIFLSEGSDQYGGDSFDDAVAIYDISGLSVDEPVNLRFWFISTFAYSMGVRLSEVTPDFPPYVDNRVDAPETFIIDVPEAFDYAPPVFIDFDVTSKVAELQAANQQYLQVYMQLDSGPSYSNTIYLKLSIPEPSSLALSAAPLAGLALWLRKRLRAETA